MYTKETLARFRKPKFAGEIKNADGVGQLGNVKCLVADEKIHSTNEVINIKALSKHKAVISHDGKYHQISEIHHRTIENNVITIKNKLGTTTVTPEHLIFAVKVPKEVMHTKVKKKLVPAWYHAFDLERRDITLYPVFSEITNTEHIYVDLSKPKYDFRSIKIPKKIKIDADFLRFCGYFLAEGHANVKTCRNVVSLSFSSTEQEYVEDVCHLVKKIFGLNPKMSNITNHNLITIRINNVFLAKLLKKMFGCGAENKKIPEFMMMLPPEKQKHLIIGLWRGDGYANLQRKWSRAGYTTISEQLAHQMKTLLLRQNIVPSLYYEKAHKSKWANHKPAYRIHIGDRNSMIKLMKLLDIEYRNIKPQKDHSWFDKLYLYTPITKHETKLYKGEVYNLEVPETHSFATTSLLAHNCGDVMKIFIKVEKNRIKDIKFQTYGCVAAIAASDMMCELVKGKTLEQALKIKYENIIKRLGDLPKIKYHCSVLSTEALKKAIDDYRNKQKNLKTK